MTRGHDNKMTKRREEGNKGCDSHLPSSLLALSLSSLPPLHELLAHSHLLIERQRRQGSIGPVGPLLCVHAEGTRDGEPVAIDRFFVGACSPAAAIMAMRNYGPERDHLLFVVDAPPERQRAFVRAGFRLVETQWMMGCELVHWQSPVPPATTCAVQRAQTAADCVTLSAIDGLEPVALDELLDPALMHYYVTVDGQPAAYGRSARYDEEIAWVSHVHTAPQHRRQGCATALMIRLLTDCASSGVVSSVLLSTAMARSLYARLGYAELASVAILSASPILLRRTTR